MVSKGLSICRGSHSSSLMAKAAIAGAVLTALGLTASAASATTVYQESFSGSSTLGTLNGSAPTVDNGPSSTWTASQYFADSGYTSVVGSTPHGQNAYLAFAPVSGQIYTLTAGIDVTGTGSTPLSNEGNYFAALGFMTTPATSGGWYVSGASPWVLNGLYSPTGGSDGTNNTNGAAYSGPGLDGGQGFGTVDITSGVNTYSIVLNTGSAAYSYAVYLTNSAHTNLEVGSGKFTTNPVITAVGLENAAGTAQVSNFSLTEQAVPEPATLGLMAIGGLGLLLLKRRKTV